MDSHSADQSANFGRTSVSGSYRRSHYVIRLRFYGLKFYAALIIAWVGRHGNLPAVMFNRKRPLCDTATGE